MGDSGSANEEVAQDDPGQTRERSLFTALAGTKGLSTLEVLLSWPFLILYCLPSALLAVVEALLGPLLSSFRGKYVATDGSEHVLSPIATFGDRNFSTSALESRHLPFPAIQPLAWANAQVCALSAELAYEDWAVVENAVMRWNAGHQEADFVAAYTVESISWELSGGGGETVTLDMGSIGVFIARVNGAIIVAFRGRSPLTAGEWLFAADCGSGEDEVGTFGRIHSSFRTVLGLDIDLRSLSQGHIRTRVSFVTPDDHDGDFKDVGSALYDMLRSRIRAALGDDRSAPVLVTGHGMGGALALVFAAALAVNEPASGADVKEWIHPKIKAVYTFGQPRIGDPEFVYEVKRRLQHTSQHPRIFRVVNSGDIMASMPPQGSKDLSNMDYQHCGQLICISPSEKLYATDRQPSLRLATVLLVSLISALRTTKQWLRSHSLPGQSELAAPPLALLLAKWSAFSSLGLTHGIVQHLPANYSMALKRSTPGGWSLEQMLQAGRARKLRSLWEETVTYSKAAFRFATRSLDRALPVADVSLWCAKVVHEKVVRPRAWQRSHSGRKS